MKARYIIYCALIALAVFSVPASADCNIVIVGDANSDGRITTADSLLALQMSVGSMPPDIERADVNYDGDVNSLDALMILTMAQKTQVRVNAPEVVSGAFNVTIDIYNAVDLDSGQFDLSFDPSVVNVTAVCDGNIDGTTVPIDSWEFLNADTIRVLFNLPGVDDVRGSGQIATIGFEITGVVKDESVLDISDGLLVDTGSDEMSALWFDDDVTIGVSVNVSAPEIASGDTFDITIDIADVSNLDSGQFDLSFDPNVVNVTSVDSGSIDGAEVPIDMWRLMDAGSVRVLFRLPGATGVSGSGSLATISFEVTGTAGDRSVLDILEGLLVDTGSDEIPALWNDCEVAIGVSAIVNVPEVVSGTFDATIEIADVTNLDSGQFDLSFDPSVVNITGVDSGSVDGTEVPIDLWRSVKDAGMACVLFNLPDITGVSGSGSLATIHFEVTGTAGDTSALDISDGLLVDTMADKIPATWTGDDVAIGVPVTVNAPEVVSGTFDATIDIADVANLDSGQFDLGFDAGVVNVTGVSSGSVDGTVIPFDDWTVMHGTDNWDCDKLVRVIFDMPEVTGVSGSGQLATIHFEVTGTVGDTGVLDLSDGLLVDTGSDEMPTLWNDCGITVGVPVTVNAPEVVSGTFDATIDIADVANLDSGQFDLSFNASVVNVTGVDSGSISTTEVRLDGWAFRDSDTVRVIFNLPGATGMSGSGSLATIHFTVTGASGDTSVLDISDGLLVDTGSDKIPTVWIDDEMGV
ncbi:MAG: cohesin domain-containing protein [Euryarchaeota archaeon]|nr:cohesin domain-containing protein [Euryarchaeota archaeon]